MKCSSTTDFMMVSINGESVTWKGVTGSLLYPNGFDPWRHYSTSEAGNAMYAMMKAQTENKLPIKYGAEKAIH